jgi:hypothetical protein
MTDPLAMVRSEVQRLIACLRPFVGRLEPDAIASDCEVRLDHRELAAPLLGATLANGTIIVSTRLPDTLARLTFGHELAHVLMARGWFAALPTNETEAAADAFARELLLPNIWLAGSGDPWQCAAMAGADVAVCAMQLGRAGMAPVVTLYGSSVLCSWCGANDHRRRCTCAPYRTGSRALTELPTLSELGAPSEPQQLTLPVGAVTAWH